MSKTRSCLSGLVLLMLGLVVGAVVGMVLGWWVWPVSYVDTDLVDLRPGHQDDYILMISDAYLLDGNLAEVQRRLALLQEPEVGRRVASLIRSKIASKAGPDEVRSLIFLAHALRVDTQDMLDYVATSTPTPTPLATATRMRTRTPTPTSSPTSSPTPTATETLASPSLPVRPTLRPTLMPTVRRIVPEELPRSLPTETPYTGGWELSLTPPPTW